MGCKKLQLQDYFRLIKPENNPIKYCEAGFTIDKLGNETITIYDDRGNVIETQYPDNTVSRSAYDAKGRAYITQDRHFYDPNNPSTEASANGSRTYYNAIGQAVRSERLANVDIQIVNDGGAQRSEFTSAGNIISFTLTEYDRAGRTVKSTAANGAISRNEYDNAGRTLAVIDTLGNRTSYTYNAAGQQTAVTDALGRTTRYEYDALGRRVRTIFADGTFTAVEYNTLGQKIKETTPGSKGSQNRSKSGTYVCNHLIINILCFYLIVIYTL